MQIDQHDMNRLKQQCMGKDLYQVQFEYTIEIYTAISNGEIEVKIYVQTHYGYFHLNEDGDWIDMDAEEDEEDE